ncbi:MAG: 50S ribosomal protein L18 [Candidatus Omnitrophica bacterium]|nr:50S ribosomal protein L18 [Candidatus Omnitrophota bacterium]MCM8826869.1 50S ribosomal protein L18 [Candidatus Omnitrophota bacterium]
MKTIARARRHRRITKRMRGSKERPRLVVFRSKKHIYAQLVDDSEGKVLTGFSTLSKEFHNTEGKSDNGKKKTNNQAAAKEVGLLIAKKAKQLGIEKVCFDRAGYKYHGRIKALAEGVREGGVKF